MSENENEYKHPETILHVPDFYGAGGSRMRKYKDRFSTTVATAATSLVKYLEWPGDVRGYRPDRPRATELGTFAVYRIDREATAKLRAELETMDPAKRHQPNPSGWGAPLSDRAFSKKVREAIARATGQA